MAAAPANPDEFRMSFGDHLEELRGRLVRAMIGVFLMAVITFVFGRDIVKWLTEPLLRAQIAAGLPPQTVVPDVTAGFFIYIKISLIGALILAAPWVLFQMWKFIEAGLYSHERKVVYLLAPFSTAMMVLAVAFMYYVMLPVSLAFLLFFAVSFGPSGGQSKDPLAFLSKYVSSFAGAKDGEGEGGWHPVGTMADSLREHPAFIDEATPLLRPGLTPGSPSGLEIAGHLGYAMVHHPAIVRAVEPLESSPLPARVGTGGQPGFGRVPELDADPASPEPGQMWVNRRENALKVRVDNRTLVAYLAVSSLVSPLIDLQKYINFVLFMTLGIVIAFQMPVAMTVLGWTGILKAQVIGQYRKYMFFICFCLGAIITPSSDPVSMTLMAMPLYLLFELGLVLMRLTQRPLIRDEVEDDWEDDDEDDDEEYEDDDEGEEDDEEDDDSDEKDEEEDPREQPMTT